MINAQFAMRNVKCKMVLTLAVGCGTLVGVFAELPNCGYL
jgi:hypothetical protein